MIRNLFFLLIGSFCGIWLIWPQVITSKGWECANDVISSSDEELSDIESILESLPNKIKLGLAISHKTLLKSDNLNQLEKLRIVGDACFR